MQFHPNYRRTLELILWVLNKQPGIHVYNLVNTFFEADVYSINKYGYPIIGDTYKAMEYGITSSLVYEGFINQAPWLLDALDLASFPFEIRNGYELYATRLPNEDYVSSLDHEVLLIAGKESTLPFEELRYKFSKHEAWWGTWQYKPEGIIDWGWFIKDRKLHDALVRAHPDCQNLSFYEKPKTDDIQRIKTRMKHTTKHNGGSHGINI